MAEAFKNLINAQVMRQVGHHLHRAWPAFERGRFETLALDGLEALEFKGRAEHLSRALQATLPASFPAAAELLEASLKAVPPPRFEHDPDQELGQATATDDSGVAGWALWGYGDFIARQGQAHPERALRALHALTQRFTAEYAIRPFIVRHPALVFQTLAGWTRDPSAHVRRLVSEGSRPRLPWGLRLQALVADPSPTLPLLEALQDDPSEYVRRSVANHLNDIAKDHPQHLVAWLDRHLPQAPAHRQRLLRHASRTLIKAGHMPVLQAWGQGTPFHGSAALSVSPRAVAVGGLLDIALTLVSTAAQPQSLEIDYRVHHVKANGTLLPKIFKGCRATLAPGETWTWRKRHSLRPVTTRRYHAGTHVVDIQVNGQVLAQAPFELSLPD